MVKVHKIFKKAVGVLFEFLVVAAIFSLLQENVFLLGFVPTPSMHPNVPVGSRILALRDTKNLEMGDLVVFGIPEWSTDYYIKRLIGLPGDKVEVRGGKLFVNDEFIDIYSEFGSIGELGADLINQEEGYFVMGDNLEHSLDSRVIGRIGLSRLVGEVKYHKVF